MIQQIFYILIVFSMIFPNVFPTTLGECTLELYDGKVEDIPEIVQLVLDV